MATANLGRVGFVNKGTYSGATAYKVNDVVVYNGGTYACIQANIGQAPTNTSYWQNWIANDKALDSTVVHKTGDETIAGVKTFSSSIVGNITGNAGNATTATTATNVNGGTVNATTGRFANDIITSQSITIGTGGNFSAGSIYSDSNCGMIFRAKQPSPNTAEFMWTKSNGDELFRFNGTALTTNITGNAGTSVALVGDETNWATYRSRSVANMLSWKNFGNGHCIFDASNGTAPNGVAVNNTNADIPWNPKFPTLMGWNGGNTFGVRVDSARVADSATNIPHATSTTYGGIKASLSGTTLTITL